MADYLLLIPVSENKRPPYWNSTSGLQCGHVVHFGMMPSITLPNFTNIHLYRAMLLTFTKNPTSQWSPCGTCNTVTINHSQSHTIGLTKS